MYIDRQYQTSTDCLSITDIKNSPLFNMYPRSRCSTRLLTSMSIFKNEVLIVSFAHFDQRYRSPFYHYPYQVRSDVRIQDTT